MVTDLNLSISHEFNANNEWVAYEYIEDVSDGHVRILKYNSSGKLVSSKHIFKGVPQSGSIEEFVNYMNRTKSAAINDNLSWQEEERKSRSIDLSSSFSEVMRSKMK